MSGLTQVLEIFQDGGTGGGGNVMGTGAAGQIAFWTGINTIAGDNNAFWDNVNKRLILGAVSGPSTLTNTGTATFSHIRTTAISGNIALTDFYVGSVPVPPAAITLTLPSAAAAGAGKIYIIKDQVGAAGVGTELTIAAAAGQTIDLVGSIAYNIPFVSRIVYSLGGTAWVTVGGVH